MDFMDNKGSYQNTNETKYVCEKHNREYFTLCTACAVEEFDMVNRQINNTAAFDLVYGDWPEEGMELEADYSWDDTHHFINTLNVKG